MNFQLYIDLNTLYAFNDHSLQINE